MVLTCPKRRTIIFQNFFGHQNPSQKVKAIEIILAQSYTTEEKSIRLVDSTQNYWKKESFQQNGLHKNDSKYHISQLVNLHIHRSIRWLHFCHFLYMPIWSNHRLFQFCYGWWSYLNVSGFECSQVLNRRMEMRIRERSMKIVMMRKKVAFRRRFDDDDKSNKKMRMNLIL